MLSDEQHGNQEKTPASKEVDDLLTLDDDGPGEEEDKNSKAYNGNEDGNIVVLPVSPVKGISSQQVMLPAAEIQRSEEQLEKVRRRQEVYFQTRRQKKKRKVLFNRIRFLLKLIFAALFSAAVYLGASAPFWIFNVENLSLKGGNLLEREHLAKFFEPFDSKPLYLVNPIKLEGQIKREIPLVKDIYIRRQLFPASIEISLVEKPSWGMLYLERPEYTEQSEPYIKEKPSLDDNIQVVEPETTEIMNDKKQVKPAYILHWDNSITDLAPYSFEPQDIEELGNPVAIFAYNSTIKPKTFEVYREIAYLFASKPEKAKLLYLDVSSSFDIYAYFEGFKVRIGRADSTVFNRIGRLFSLFPAIEEYLDQLDYVDLRWQHQVLFKKKQDSTIASKTKDSPADD